MSPSNATTTDLQSIVLLGNPNAGKTTLFNALTGLRYTTGNYPGVTVEKKEGRLKLSEGVVNLLDLPGTYSLVPRSLDEQIVHDVLLGFQEDTPRPDLALLVLDASNLERNLYLASQVIELGVPTIVVLNMWDIVQAKGIQVDANQLETLLGVPCVPMVSTKRSGLDILTAKIEALLAAPKISNFQVPLSALVEKQLEGLAPEVEAYLPEGISPRSEALRLLSDHNFKNRLFEEDLGGPALQKQVQKARAALESQNVDWASVEAEKRYACLGAICQQVVQQEAVPQVTWSDRLDRVLTHRFWGLFAFAALMSFVFQAIFSWANAPMDWIAAGVEATGALFEHILPAGQLQDLMVNGVVAGVGNVVIFLPQIFLLFLFIGLMEDSGYMARAAFVLDRIMKRVGLNGKAFLPLLSSFACAIPGVMATRTIEDRNDRMATILVAPLMSCSARIPVYALMIGAFIPSVQVLGFFNLKGVTLFAMYALSIVAGLGMAALFRSTFLKGNKTPFVFELPPYKVPQLKLVLARTWDRGKEFIVNAGTIVFCISIILWFLASYPKAPELEAQFETQRIAATETLSGDVLEERLAIIENTATGEKMRSSYAGQLGQLIEPVIEPLGFDWKIGIGLVASFAAREVLVSTLAIVYNVGSDADETSVGLIQTLQSTVNPETGQPLYTPLVAISLMVFFVLACQCMSTLAVVKRETNSWRWPLFMLAYMTALAWIGSLVVYQGGRLLGFS